MICAGRYNFGFREVDASFSDISINLSPSYRPRTVSNLVDTWLTPQTAVSFAKAFCLKVELSDFDALTCSV